MTITPATSSDLPAILDLQKLCYQENAARIGDWNIPPLTQTLDSLSRELASGTILIVELAGRISGSVRGRLEGKSWLIGKLIVHPDCQNRGYGRQLLAAIEQIGAAAGAGRLELFTGHLDEKNLAFYQKAGYRIFRRDPASPKLTLIYLEKNLPASYHL